MTDSDRALLDAAARAAGIYWWADDDGPLMTHGDDGPGSSREWNPLTDDGDEARLEAALRMDVVWLQGTVRVHNTGEIYADHGGDKQAARRRAGVRAAASMAAERMP